MTDIDLMTRLISQIFRLNGLLLEEGARMTVGTTISNSRWRVLGTLTRAGGALTVPQIAREMGHTRQGIQRLVDAMVKDGVLEYLDNPAHATSRNVSLTPAGKGVYIALSDRRIKSLDAIGKGLSQKQIFAAAALLDELEKNLERRA